MSDEFKFPKFPKKGNGIKHKRVSACHPASNGAAEISDTETITPEKCLRERG